MSGKWVARSTAGRSSSLECVNDLESALHVASQFLWVDLIARSVSHILSMMVGLGVVVDLIQFVVKILRRMLIATLTNLPNDIA